MSNIRMDLVKQLRHEAFHTGYKPKKPWDLMVDAADAIERRNELLKRLVFFAKTMDLSGKPYGPDHPVTEAEAVIAQVEAE